MNCTPSASCYQRCGRPDCRERRLRYLKERRVYGPKRIPSGPTVERVRELRRTYSLGYIGAALGMDSGHVSTIESGKHPTIHRDVAARIAAFRPDPTLTYWVDATGTRRRLQALILSGHPTRKVAAMLGYSPHWAYSVSQGRARMVSQDRATATADLFRRLWDKPAPAGRSAKLASAAARLHGFVPAQAWDDIDDPSASPNLGAAPDPDAWLEDVAWLAAQGLSLPHVASRLGVTGDTLERRLHRHGRGDLVGALKGRAA